MNEATRKSLNGWGVVFRFITPAFLGVLLWTVQDMKTDLRLISTSLTALDQTLHVEASSIRDRVSNIEGRLVALDGIKMKVERP